MSTGALAPNKRPILIKRILDPLGINPAFELYLIPPGKITAEHRQLIALAAPERDGADGMDRYATVTEIQRARMHASMLLMHRSSPRCESGAFLDIGVDEGLYEQYLYDPVKKEYVGARRSDEKKIELPRDPAKYEEICIIAATGL